MKLLKRLIVLIKGEKSNQSYGHITPKGIRITMVPREFIDENKNPTWDSHLFKNQQIV